MPNPFSELRLDLGYDYGANGGHKWKTTIIEHGDGIEQRNAEWTTPLGEWSIGDRTFHLEDGESFYLKDFFEARQGSYEGFRWKDWSDYRATDSVIGTGNGAKTQFQLVKRYAVGGVFYDRTITKPVPNTLSLKVNGVTTAASVNTANGLVTFPSPPAPGATITATFEFDVPVQFREDSCTLTLLGAIEESGEQIWQISALSVEEIRVSPGLWPTTGFSSTEPFLAWDLGILSQSSAQIESQTISVNSAGGWRSVMATRSAPRTTFTFDRLYNRSELETLQNYFWVCHGSHLSFAYLHNGQSGSCRFVEDTFSARFEAAGGQDDYWNVSFRLVTLP